jgi:hypothetical protein
MIGVPIMLQCQVRRDEAQRANIPPMTEASTRWVWR